MSLLHMLLIILVMFLVGAIIFFGAALVVGRVWGAK